MKPSGQQNCEGHCATPLLTAWKVLLDGALLVLGGEKGQDRGGSGLLERIQNQLSLPASENRVHVATRPVLKGSFQVGLLRRAAPFSIVSASRAS